MVRVADSLLVLAIARPLSTFYPLVAAVKCLQSYKMPVLRIM